MARIYINNRLKNAATFLNSFYYQRDRNYNIKSFNMLLLKNMQKICFYNILLQRSFGTNQSLFFYKEINKEFKKFKLKQAKMQCDDGLPVYLKSGIRDKILFNITLALLLCNTVGSIYSIRELFRKF